MNNIKKYFNSSILIAGYLSAVLILLFVLILRSTSKVVFDERDFMPNFYLMKKLGFSFDFLKQLKNQSPGPLYQYIYYLMDFFIPVSPKVVRISNYFIYLGDLYLIYLLLKAETKNGLFVLALLFTAIPNTVGIAGIGMTEAPSLLFCLGAVLLLKRSLEQSGPINWALAALAGVCMGLSIIGRTPFLMVLPAVFVLITKADKIMHILLFLIFASVLPLIMFCTWHGLVPPYVQGIQSGYNLFFLFLTIMYFAINTLIIYPEFFLVKKIHYLIGFLVAIVALLLNMLVFKVDYTAMNGVVKTQNSGGIFVTVYRYSFLAFSVGVSYVTLVAFSSYVKKNKPDRWHLFYMLICAFILVSTIKSPAHFSSRYVLQAYPFFILYVSRNIKINWLLLFTVIIGTIIGLTSLINCYAIFAASPYNP